MNKTTVLFRENIGRTTLTETFRSIFFIFFYFFYFFLFFPF